MRQLNIIILPPIIVFMGKCTEKAILLYFVAVTFFTSTHFKAQHKSQTVVNIRLAIQCVNLMIFQQTQVVVTLNKPGCQHVTAVICGVFLESCHMHVSGAKNKLLSWISCPVV